jgi:hypothetical protein
MGEAGERFEVEVVAPQIAFVYTGVGVAVLGTVEQ